jgi:phosphorylcholine metabolism protein LicD
VIFTAVVVANVFVQHLMIFSAHSNWQTMMKQMRKQNRQIITFINVVSQLVSSITKLKRKLTAMFFSDDLAITDTQRASNKRVVKFTKRAQTIRIEIVRIKRAKIHEESIESLISLNFETTRFEQKDACL